LNFIHPIPDSSLLVCSIKSISCNGKLQEVKESLKMNNADNTQTPQDHAASPSQVPLNPAQRYQLPLQVRQNDQPIVNAPMPPLVATAVPVAARREESPPPAKRPRRTVNQIYVLLPWNDMLYQLLRFRAEKEHCMVPYKTGGELGRWVASQRSQYLSLQRSKDEVKAEPTPMAAATVDANRLTEERVGVLSSIGFVWDVVQADNDERWKKRFIELVEYKRVHGHCNAPQSSELGKWVKMQRETKAESDLKKSGTRPSRKKQRPCLSDDRIAQLEAIGFQWRLAKPPVGWDSRFEQLKEYRGVHGHCNVPQSYEPDKPFGRWVMKQRCERSQKLRGLKSQMTVERETRLDAIGFEWMAPGFHKKNATMPGEEEEDEDIDDQGGHRTWDL
jgi:hypothetical protein